MAEQGGDDLPGGVVGLHEQDPDGLPVEELLPAARLGGMVPLRRRRLLLLLVVMTVHGARRRRPDSKRKHVGVVWWLTAREEARIIAQPAVRCRE